MIQKVKLLWTSFYIFLSHYVHCYFTVLYSEVFYSSIWAYLGPFGFDISITTESANIVVNTILNYKTNNMQ